jgi:hypothetical protein
LSRTAADEIQGMQMWDIILWGIDSVGAQNPKKLGRAASVCRLTNAGRALPAPR